MSPRFLHVANGGSVTGTIKVAGIPGVRSIWADPLHDGPVPGNVSDDELLEVRRQFLSRARPGDDVDPGNDLREWRAALMRRESYDEIILWFEHDLFDQLNLIQLLTWIRDHVPSRPTVSLICIGEFPGHPEFQGLGELSPAELATLVPTRQHVSDAQYDLARRAWAALRASTPEALDTLRRDDTAALPFLAGALTRLLQEYPSTRDGLSRTERRLLELASAGDLSLIQAFLPMHDGERAYYVTDTSLVELAEDLSRPPAPLLTMTRPDAAANPIRAVVGLTAAGRSVLAGQSDRVALRGIDRWIGGVHLQGAAAWRWDDERGRVVQIPT